MKSTAHVISDLLFFFLFRDSSTDVIKSNPAKSKKKEKKQIASASTALIFGSILGLMQAIFLVFGAKSLLNLMGVKDVSAPCNLRCSPVLDQMSSSNVLGLQQTEFTYVSPCPQVLNIKITWCSCCSSVIGHARDL